MPRRNATHQLTAAQLRITSSPITFEVFEALLTCRPTTVAELGPQLGRKPNSLHYHVRKLVGLGLVRKVGTRAAGARTEVVYDLIARDFRGSGELKTPAQRSSKRKAVDSILRLASRDFETALKNPQSLTISGRRRDLTACRSKAWLTREQLASANVHIEALHKIFQASRTSQEGKLVALTMVLTPQVVEDSLPQTP